MDEAKEKKRKKEERWILATLILCAVTFAGLVVGSAALLTS